MIVLGKDNCAEFKAELEAAGLQTILLEKPGRIRENLTLHCPDQPETRISFAGFSLEDSVLREVLEALPVDGDTVVTFTGRVASGMSIQKVKEFLLELKSRGAKLVLDSKSLTLEDIFTLKPWLIKPNQEEISAYFNCWIESVEQALEKAAVFAQHGTTNVMISLGEQGAMLIHGGKSYLAKPPVIHAVSTIGAGDSAIAGFIAATMAGKDPGECLQTAVTYGSAACLTEGTLPPLPQDTAAIFPSVKLEII